MKVWSGKIIKIFWGWIVIWSAKPLTKVVRDALAPFPPGIKMCFWWLDGIYPHTFFVLQDVSLSTYRSAHYPITHLCWINNASGVSSSSRLCVAQTKTTQTAEQGIWYLNHLSWLLLTWRNTVSTLSSSQMSKLLVLSLRQSQATLWWRLFSVGYIRSLVLPRAHDHRTVDWPVNWELCLLAQLSLHQNGPV